MDSLEFKSLEIKQMVETNGWKHLHEWIKTQVEYYRNKLEICPLEELKEVRGRIQALRSILEITNAWIKEGKK